MQTEIKFTTLDILNDRGFKPLSNINFCTSRGINYYVGYRDNWGAIVAIIEDEEVYMIDKKELREMASNARIKGIDEIILYTNYGLELHSKYEKPKNVNMTKIIKVDSEGYNANRKIFKL